MLYANTVTMVTVNVIAPSSLFSTERSAVVLITHAFETIYLQQIGECQIYGKKKFD